MDVDVNVEDVNVEDDMDRYLLDMPANLPEVEELRLAYMEQLDKLKAMGMSEALLALVRKQFNAAYNQGAMIEMSNRFHAASNRAGRISILTADKLAKREEFGVAKKLECGSPEIVEITKVVKNLPVPTDITSNAGVSSEFQKILDSSFAMKKLPAKEYFERQVHTAMSKLRTARNRALEAKDFATVAKLMFESKHLAESFEQVYKPMLRVLGYAKTLQNLASFDPEIGGVSFEDWAKLGNIQQNEDYKSMLTGMLRERNPRKRKSISSVEEDSDTSGEFFSAKELKKLTAVGMAIAASLNTSKGNFNKKKGFNKDKGNFGNQKNNQGKQKWKRAVMDEVDKE